MRNIAAIFLLSVLLVSCTSQPVRNIENQGVASFTSGGALSLSQVESAIMVGSVDRGWTPRIVSQGLIEASINVRMHRAVVEIPYSSSAYSIRYKDSSNLDYRGGSIHRNFNRWIANLSLSIQRELARGSQGR